MQLYIYGYLPIHTLINYTFQLLKIGNIINNIILITIIPCYNSMMDSVKKISQPL